MPRKKIVWLCSWYPCKTDPFNGDFIQRHAKAAALYNDIHVIHVAGDDTGVVKHTEETIQQANGLTEQLLYFKKGKSFLGKIIAQYKWAKLFRHAIRQYISKNGKPDAVHVQVPMKAGIIALWMKRKYGLPFIVTEHWGIYNNIVEDNYRTQNKAFQFYTKKIIEAASTFISVSEYLAKGMNEMVTKKDYHVIPNVADTDHFFYKEKQNPAFRFIHVSNMVPLKNTAGILRAFKIIAEQQKNAELVMVGNRNDEMRKYAVSLGLHEPLVSFRGEIAYEKVAKEMQQADCLLLFSNIENSPCVIGEALCCGLPVIASNVGGIPELVNDSNAMLVPPKDENALVSVMQKMMLDHSLYQRRQIAVEAGQRFSYGVIGKKMDELYLYL